MVGAVERIEVPAGGEGARGTAGERLVECSARVEALAPHQTRPPQAAAAITSTRGKPGRADDGSTARVAATTITTTTTTTTTNRNSGECWMRVVCAAV